jgi:glycine cleavage system aminomethyltransferase T
LILFRRANYKDVAPTALGYVRREANQIGTELTLQGTGESAAKIVELPFVK